MARTATFLVRGDVAFPQGLSCGAGSAVSCWGWRKLGPRLGRFVGRSSRIERNGARVVYGRERRKRDRTCSVVPVSPRISTAQGPPRTLRALQLLVVPRWV